MDYGQQYIPYICIINIPDMYIPNVETRRGTSPKRDGFYVADLRGRFYTIYLYPLHIYNI